MAPPIVYRILAFVVSYLPAQLRANLWRRLIGIGARRWPSYMCAAQRIPGDMFVKQSLRGGLMEGQAIQFVAAHTSIPVPVVVDNLVYRGRSYLVLSRLPGRQLAEIYPDIPPEAEQHLSTQISLMFAPLRALPPPFGAVCGFDGGPVNCVRLSSEHPLGPWESVATFHKELMLRTGGLVNIPEGVDSEKIHDVIRSVHEREYPICLTHNDFGPHNILVDDHWNITGVVDWETCAWMPEYWERTKGCFLWQYREGRWNRILSSAFPQYDMEYDAENYITSYRLVYA